MNLKCLQLEHWMNKNNRFFSETIAGYEEIKPKVRKNGLYCLGSNSWFEIDGQAWKYDKETFDYTLNQYNFEKCSNKTFEALKQLIMDGLATKEQVAFFSGIETARFKRTCNLNKFRMKRLIKK